MRRLHLLFALAVLVAIGTAAHAAAPNAPGVNLRWDQCYGDGGAWNKVFACNTNVGFERLVLSFELTEPKTRVQSLLFHVALTSASPTLPAWWSMMASGGCRTGLGFDASAPVGSSNCTDWADGIFGSISDYTPSSPNSMVIFGGEAASVGQLRDLVPGVEYAVGAIAISRNKTVGAGSCGGCATPVCLLFSDLRIDSTPATPGSRTWLTQGANYSGSAIAYWQGAYVQSVTPHRFDSGGFIVPAVITSCVPYSTTAAKPSTWGAVKSLYR